MVQLVLTIVPSTHVPVFLQDVNGKTMDRVTPETMAERQNLYCLVLD